MSDIPFTHDEMQNLLESLCFHDEAMKDNGIARVIGRDSIRVVIRALQGLLFPQCASQEAGSHALNTVSETLANLVDLIHEATTTHQCPEGGCPEREKSSQTARLFFEALPHIQQDALTDVEAAFEGDPAARDRAEIISTYPGFYATLVYRLAHRLHTLNVPLLPRMMTEIAHSDAGIDIHPGATIGRYFFIDHGTGVVIGETTQIGEHVTLYQGVTLGALNFPHDQEGHIIRGTKRHPTIEHDVVIYSEATILGGDTIVGHNSVIGGNVWLTEGVPPFSKVTTKSTIALRTRQEPVS